MRHRHNPVPGPQPGDACAHIVHDAGHVVAEYARHAQARPASVGTVPGIDGVDAGSQNPYPDLAGTRNRIGHLGQPELLWPAELIDDNRPHDVLPRYVALIN
jgi:hypothetical protein